MEKRHSEISEIKITLDSKNRENNKIIINNIDVTGCLTGLNLSLKGSQQPELSVDFVLF